MRKIHFTDKYLLSPYHPKTVLVAGAGGTGSQVITSLARMSVALHALGHPGQHQTAFDPALPNPVSLAQAGGRKFIRSRRLETFLVRCLRRYAQLERGEKEALQHAYREGMYRLGEQHPYRLPDGTLFQAAIEGVLPSGELILRHADGTRHEYLFREIEFVIAGKQGNAGPAEK